MSATDFLAVGHIAHDLVPYGIRLGGTVSFAALTAQRLGRHPAILTRGTPELIFGSAVSTGSAIHGPGAAGSALVGIEVHLLPSPVSTTFLNVYRDNQRTQVIEARAADILPADLPVDWQSVPVVLLGPLACELPSEWAQTFPDSLVGVTPQGWMRQWDADGRVSPAPWHDADEFLERAGAVILSREDVGGDDCAIAQLASRARLLVATDGWHGAVIYERGRSYRVPPRQAIEVDPTGAGDVFATSFLLHLAATGDPYAAARFANVVASMSVEAVGVAGIPTQAQVEAYLQQHDG